MTLKKVILTHDNHSKEIYFVQKQTGDTLYYEIDLGHLIKDKNYTIEFIVNLSTSETKDTVIVNNKYDLFVTVANVEKQLTSSPKFNRAFSINTKVYKGSIIVR